MLQVRMFGSMRVTQVGASTQSACVHLIGRPRSLFAYLLLHAGRSFSRSELLAVLWSDRGDHVARGSLNTTLWRLRKLLGPAFHQAPRRASREEIGLPLEHGIDCDVAQFVQLLEPCLRMSLAQVDPADIQRLRAAIDLYKADILCNLTDDWVPPLREKFRRLHQQALTRLLDLSELRGDFESAIRYAQVSLECDGLREDMHRRLMRLFVLNGQQPLALRQYETCRCVLIRELAVHPARLTHDLYREIAKGSLSPTTSADVTSL